MLHAVIMAGGSGTRFWPMSRQSLPKQFLKLHGERTLLQQAVERIVDLTGTEQVLVVTSDRHASTTRTQLPTLPTTAVVGEPCGRDTAACIGLAAALIHRLDPEGMMMVLAADHLITPIEKFHQAVRAAATFIEQHPQSLVTFGIPPTYPSTGYGYLRQAEPAGVYSGVEIRRLRSFHEKPSLPTAEQFLATGEYFWNCGIFCWKAATILNELRQHAPAVHSAAHAIANVWGTPQQDEVFRQQFEPLKKVSIDYAVMEKSQSVFMVPAPFTWDDVGGWLAMERVLPEDASGNVRLGQVQTLDASGCVLAADAGALVAAIGVKDLIIVHAGDATLVAHKDQEQAVKKILEQIEQSTGTKYL